MWITATWRAKFARVFPWKSCLVYLPCYQWISAACMVSLISYLLTHFWLKGYGRRDSQGLSAWSPVEIDERVWLRKLARVSPCESPLHERVFPWISATGKSISVWISLHESRSLHEYSHLNSRYRKVEVCNNMWTTATCKRRIIL